MLTIEKLNDFGADTAKGLERCMNNEPFYFRMIGLAIADANFSKLEEALKENDLEHAFEAAHALKGTTGNLSLDPIYEPVCEITELLRAKADADYSGLFEIISSKLEELKKIVQE